MKKQIIILLAGMVLGMALLSGGYAAATTVLTATPSTQTFHINGQSIQFEAYSIHGNNFVKLRDIGKAVDFGVDYDAATNTVYISSSQPYHEEITQSAQPAAIPTATGEYTISTDHWSREDFSQQANPAVFTGIYDRALYNTIRQTLVDGDAGNVPAYTMVAQGSDYSAVKNLIGRLDNEKWFEHYVPKNFASYWQYPNYFAVSAKTPMQYQNPLTYIQPVVNYVNQMNSDREKATYLNDYLCTLLSYESNQNPGVTQIFASHDIELKAACGSYSVAYNFLCGAAGIPCFTVSSSNHTWNMVYVDGQWFHVDVATNDVTHSHTSLFRESYPTHIDTVPEATAFLKELLVPGSTK